MLLAINDISLLVIGFSVMILIMVSFVVSFRIMQRKKLLYQQHLHKLREAQQNQLIEAAVRSEESERHRIAESLHDEVGAILSSSKLHLQAIKTSSLDEKDRQLNERGKELLDEGIQKVRSISHNLHSSILKEFGLNEAIRHFVSKTVQGSLISTTCQLDDSYTTVNTDNDISIYRMVQELVNNILKHSNATIIQIDSTYADAHLKIIITHDGTGLSQNQFEEFRYKKEGLGLKNIMNRVILLKGDIQFTKDDNRYKVTINIPINQ